MLEPWQRSVLEQSIRLLQSAVDYHGLHGANPNHMGGEAWWMRDSVDNIDRTRQRLEDHRNRLARN